MKIFVFLLAFCFVCGNTQKTVKPFCLQELRRRFADEQEVQRRYVQTGEGTCFALKSHVARCLDRSLLELARTIHPKDHTKIPSVDLEIMEEALGHYFNLDKLKMVKALLKDCAHMDDTGKPVITAGDFSKRCACDFGNTRDCLAYEHIKGIFGCGPVENVVPSQ